MNRSEIIVILISNVESHTSHTNTVSHFVTKLSQPLELRGSYECALCEVIVPGIDNENRLKLASTSPSFFLGSSCIVNVKSDIIHPTLFATSQKRVLRSVVINTEPRDTGFTHLNFESLQFHPICKEKIFEIKIKFELPDGSIVPFEARRSQVAICIRKQQQ